MFWFHIDVAPLIALEDFRGGHRVSNCIVERGIEDVLQVVIRILLWFGTDAVPLVASKKLCLGRRASDCVVKHRDKGVVRGYC